MHKRVRPTGLLQAMVAWLLVAALPALHSQLPASVSLTATRCGATVQLTWQAGQPSQCLGFNVYRAVAGRLIRLNPTLVAGGALRPAATFAWSDTPPAGLPAQYQLEEVRLDGSSAWTGAVTPSAATDHCGADAVSHSPLLDNATGPTVRTTGPTQTELPRALTALPAGDQSRQWLLAARPAVKIGVRQSDWYRVTQPQLLAAGLDPAASPRSLRLWAEGQEVPISVSAQDKARMTSTDAVEFYGVGFDIATTDTHVYWLTWGSGNGLRVPVAPSAAPAATALTSFVDVIQCKPRSLYFTLLRNGDTENYFGPIIGSQGATQTLQAPDPVLSGSASNSIALEVALQGVSTVAHTITVRLNGVALGTMAFSGQTRQLASWHVPGTALRAAANTLSLTASGGQADISLLDTVRLTYPRRLHAINNTLTFSAAGGQTVSVTGFVLPSASTSVSTAVRVLDVTDRAAPQEVRPQVQASGSSRSISFKVPGTGSRVLLAFAGGQFQVPAAVTRNNPSSWHAGHSADLVIVAHAALIASAAPLVARRHQQGLDAQVVDVEDLYDEFSYGAHTPVAIKSFLQRAQGLWLKAPRFVLLLGDASLDPRNYTGNGSFDLVPTRLIDTAFVETASDDWLVDFRNNGLPQIAVGRIPARTAAAAGAVIAKTIGYTGVTAAGQGALLVSDNERDYDFEGANDRVAALLPPSLAVQRINRDDGDAATIHSRVVAAMNTGPFLVNFVGHGSVDIWTGAGLLTTTDALQLTNANRLSLVLCSNCLNGYFVDPIVSSLGEGLIMAPAGGAVAVWASSGETYPGPQEQMSQAFLRLMFQTPVSLQPRTLGEAVLRAKAATSDLDVRRTWILFGDPTTPLPTVTAPTTADPVTASRPPGNSPPLTNAPMNWPFWPLWQPAAPAGAGAPGPSHVEPPPGS